MKIFLIVLPLIAAVCVPAGAVEIKPATTAAFDLYAAGLEAKYAARRGAEHYITFADTPERLAQMKAGTVLARPGDGTGEIAVPGGIIHHYVGGFFLPGVSIKQALASIQDYNRHKVNFAPDIVDSVIRSHKTPDDFQLYMRIVKSKMMVTDVLNTEHDIHWIYPNDKRAYCRSVTTKVAEVENAGKPNEKELPVGNDRGIVWRMNSYWFLEEKDGGVYVEHASVTLSRDLPFVLSKVLGPILHSVPIETQKSSLEKCKKAILASAGKTS